MTHSIKRALALILALMLAIPAFAFAEPLEDDFEIIAFEEEADAVESAEEAAAEVELDLSELEAPEDEEGDVEVEEVADVEESSEEAALVVENPAFVQSVTTEDGMTITVKAAEGVFPDDATLSVKPVEKDLVGEVEGEIAAMYTYDIKVLSADGKELYQPDDDTLVEIIFNAPEIANDDYQTVVFHVVDEEEEIVDELIVSEDGANASVFSDHFSFYQVVFVYVNSEQGQQADANLETGKYTLSSGQVKDGVLLSEIADKVEINEDHKKLAAVLAELGPVGGPAIDNTVTVVINPAASSYLTATQYTHFESPDSAVVVYDWIITPTAAFSSATLDENMFFTVSKTYNGITWSGKVYLTKATQRFVYGVTKDKYYATLKEAVADKNTNIKVLDDLNETSAIELKDGEFVLDLTGRTVTLPSALQVYDSDATNTTTLTLVGNGGVLNAGIDLDYGAKLTVPKTIGTNSDKIYYTDSKVTVKGNITTANNATITSIDAGTFEGTLTATAITGGTFKGATKATTTISGGTFNSTVEASGAISNGTFKGAVTLATGGSISGGTFDGAVTALTGKISGGKFKNQITETTWLATTYTQYFDNGYWWVTNTQGKPISYTVYYPTKIGPNGPNDWDVYTATGVTTPDKDVYFVASSANTTLWNASTAYADYGVFTGWYNYADYATVANLIEAGTAVTATNAIIAKTPVGDATPTEGQLTTSADGSKIVFVGVLDPYMASIGTTKYTTLAAAGAAAVQSGSVATLMALLPTGSQDTYKLAAGSTLKLGFTADMLTAVQAAAQADSTITGTLNEKVAKWLIKNNYVTVEPGNEVAFSYDTGATFITFSVATHVASVTTDQYDPSPLDHNPEYYSMFFTESTDATVTKDYALNVALAHDDSILSVPAKNPAVVAVTAKVQVKKFMEIKGFDNITFGQYGSLEVQPRALLTIDSQSYAGKITGVSEDSWLNVVVGKETYEYAWNATSKTWIPDASDPAAEVLTAATTPVSKGTYPTLKQAIAAAKAGEVVKLWKANTLAVSAATGENGIVTIDKNLTLDLNGYALSSNAVNTIVVTGGATLTLKGGNNGYTANVVDSQTGETPTRSSVANTNATTASRTILVDNGTLVLSNAEVVKGTKSEYAVKATANGTLKVEKPKTGTNYAYVNGKLDLPATNPKATITAGAFTDANVAKLLTEGYLATEVVYLPTYYVVSDGAVAINTTSKVSYATLQAAIDDAKTNETIKLLKDNDLGPVTGWGAAGVTITGTAIAPKSITIDMNGKKITGSSDGTSSLIKINQAKLTLTGTGSIGSNYALFDIAVLGDPTATTGYPYGLVVSSEVKLTAGTSAASILNEGYGVQIDLNGEIVANNAVYFPLGGIADPASVQATDNVPVINIRGKIKGQVNANAYAKYDINATITNENEPAIKASAGVVTVSGGSYTSEKAAAISDSNSASKLTINGGTFTGYNYALLLGSSVTASVTGGTFKHTSTEDDAKAVAAGVAKFISGGSYTSIVPVAYLATGYACEQSDPDKDKLYVVKPAYTVTFKGMHENDAKTALVVDTDKLQDDQGATYTVAVVRNSAITKDQMAKPIKLATDKLPKYGIDYWYDEAVGASTPFVIGETPITKDTTLVAHFVTAVAWITNDYPIQLSSTVTYYATLKDAFEAWKWAVVKVDPVTQEKTYALKNDVDADAPTDHLIYKYNGKEYEIKPNTVNIKSDNITTIVNQVASALNSAGTVEIGYNVTEIGYQVDTFTVYPAAVAKATGTSTTSTGTNISNDMLEEKASFVVTGADLKPVSMSGGKTGVTVVIASDAGFTNVLQTITKQTVADTGILTVNGVNKFGYLRALGDIVASVTTSAGTTYFGTLELAVAEAKKTSGSTVTLLNDLTTLPNPVVLEGTFTLDLNGKRLTNNSGETAANKSAALLIKDVEVKQGSSTTTVASNITITDTSAKADGIIDELYINEGKSNVTIEAGTIFAITDNSLTGTLTVNGGTIEGATAINMTNTGKLVVNGGCIGCEKGANDKVAKPASDPAIRTATAINANSAKACSITINGGFVMGTTTAIHLDTAATISITGGYIGFVGGTIPDKIQTTVTLPAGENFDGSNYYRGFISGGFFAAAIEQNNCVKDTFPASNTNKDTKDAFPFTVSGDAVATYTKNNVTYYVSKIDEAVLDAAGDNTIQLIKDVAVVTPLVVDETTMIDLFGHKLTLAKITDAEFAKLTDDEKKAKGLTSVADCKYGISVTGTGILGITDTTVNDGDVAVGQGTIEGASDLLATISVAAEGTLNLGKGNVTKLGAGNAILDKGIVMAMGTVGNIASANGIAIDVVDGTLYVIGSKGTISGTNAVKYSRTTAFTTSPSSPNLVIAGGKLTGTSGAALIVDNTGKKIVTDTTNDQDIVAVTGGTFTAPTGVASIQTLDSNGAVAVKPAEGTTPTTAYVGQFVSAGYFSAPLNNDTLVFAYKAASNPKISKTVADKTTGLYTIVDMIPVTLKTAKGSFGKDKDNVDITALVVNVPKGQLLTTAAEYKLPTCEGYDFKTWNPTSGTFDYEKKEVDAENPATSTDPDSGKTVQVLNAEWKASQFTLVLDVNGGVFTEDKAYSDNLYATKGIRRTWDATAKTLTITGVPMNTVISDLVLEEATGTYKAEFAGATGTMVFNSWQNAAGKKIVVINDTVADANHRINATAIWDPMALILNADASTYITKQNYSYGTELNAEEVKAALFELAGVDPTAPEAGIKALVEKYGKTGFTLDADDMFDPAPAAAKMTAPVTYQLKWKEASAIVFQRSLNLADSIGINAYISNLPVGADLSKIYVLNSETGKKTYFNTVTPDSQGRFKFEVANLAARYMMKATTMTVMTDDGKELGHKDYSVRDYCEAGITKGGTLGDLCMACLNYGAASQLYFKYDTENLANKGYTVADPKDVPAEYAITGDPTLAAVKAVNASVALEYQTGLNVYITPADGVDPTSLTVEVSDKDGKVMDLATPVDSKGRIVVAIGGIGTSKLADKYNIKVTDKSGNTATWQRSCLNYCYTAANSDKASAELKLVAKRLYEFYDAFVKNSK